MTHLMKGRGAHLAILAWGLFFCAATAGCAYSQKADRFAELYGSGRIDDAAAYAASRDCTDYPGAGQDRLVWLIERGKALFDSGHYQESNDAFGEADRILDDFDSRPLISITEEIVAAEAGQLTRPYLGTFADRILVPTYRSLNYAALGNLADARACARRAMDRQKESLAAHDDDIDAAYSEAETYGADGPAQEIADKAISGYTSDKSWQEVTPWLNSAYADYTDPMATYVAALMLSTEGDLDNARADLKKISGTCPSNHYLREQIAHLGEESRAGRVWVLFENGSGPTLHEMRIHLPSPNGEAVMAVPTMHFAECSLASVELLTSSGARLGRSEQLASLNSVYAQDFHDRLNLLVLRATIQMLVQQAEILALQSVMQEQADAGNSGQTAAPGAKNSNQPKPAPKDQKPADTQKPRPRGATEDHAHPSHTNSANPNAREGNRPPRRSERVAPPPPSRFRLIRHRGTYRDLHTLNTERFGEVHPAMGMIMLALAWHELTTKADVRAWHALPAEVQLAGCERPADGVLTLDTLDRTGNRRQSVKVVVPDVASSIIIVRSVNAQSLSYHVIPLTPKRLGTIAAR